MTSAVAFEGSDKENDPSAEVLVPMLVPFTITEALARPLPLSSVTLPLIFLAWAITCILTRNNPKHSKNNFLISFTFNCKTNKSRILLQ
jgi:hypothetical protein